MHFKATAVNVNIINNLCRAQLCQKVSVASHFICKIISRQFSNVEEAKLSFGYNLAKLVSTLRMAGPNIDSTKKLKT